MRIEKHQLFGGVPIERVRALLRRHVGTLFSVNTIASEIGISVAQARRVLREMLAAGYVREQKQRGERTRWFERTLEGSRLAAATMAAPLKRATVERLLAELVERARSINANEMYAYRVARILLFGSAMTESEARPNDVDVAVALSRRHSDDQVQDRAERDRRAAAWARGRRFRNMVDDVFWPQTEVLLALRQRARGLSFSDANAPSRLGAESKVIFQDHPSKDPSRRR